MCERNLTWVDFNDLDAKLQDAWRRLDRAERERETLRLTLVGFAAQVRDGEGVDPALRAIADNLISTYRRRA